jgi:hypothetical protein
MCVRPGRPVEFVKFEKDPDASRKPEFGISAYFV